jgi:hypothetical protein
MNHSGASVNTHMHNILRLLISLSHWEFPNQISLLPSFLASLDAIASRLNIEKEVFTHLQMTQALIKVVPPLSISVPDRIKRGMQAQTDLDILELSTFVLEVDSRFCLDEYPRHNTANTQGFIWTEIQRLFKAQSRLSTVPPIKCLANTAVMLRTLNHIQSAQIETLVERARIDLEGDLMLTTLLGLLLARQKLYKLAEGILKPCVGNMFSKQRGAPSFAQYIAVTELLNCRNRLGMAEVGSNIATFILSSEPSSRNPRSLESSFLKIAYADSLIAQGSFSKAHELLQETMKMTVDSGIITKCGLRLSKLQRRNGHSDQASDDSSFLWEALSHLN